ncbi:MAG: YebC/PmpR family DNA-binding transcriptional regulator [Rickettsiales bacterium]|nr:YebC/PmpR family DNA-binding transcriptional regulator [Rickettsiales bacterium]
MAGHSKFKNIMHRKGAQDAKRAKLFTKLIREILVAAKNGGADPEFNPRLRTALSSARAANLPKQRIDSAIKKATSPNESNNFEEITYECYLPGGIALIVETLTDNRNRTSSDIKSILSKYGGSLAVSGAVLYLFEKIGFIEFKNSEIFPEKILEAAIEVGANDCESFENIHQIICDSDKLHEIQIPLAKQFGEPVTSRLIWRPKNQITIDSQEQAEKILTAIDKLEDNDDIQNIYGNHIIPDSLLTKLNILE